MRYGKISNKRNWRNESQVLLFLPLLLFSFTENAAKRGNAGWFREEV